MILIEEFFFKLKGKKYILWLVLVNKSMVLIFFMIMKNEVFIKLRL